jgi:uncharacterized membrane protein
VVLGRRVFPVYGTLPVLAGMAAWGTAALLPVAFIESWLTGPPAIGAGEAALVLYLGAGCSALTYGLWGYALRHLEAGCAATFDTLIPVVGLVSAVLVLREAPLVWHMVGGALVVAGVWMALSEPRPATTAHATPALLAGPSWKRRERRCSPRSSGGGDDVRAPTFVATRQTSLPEAPTPAPPRIRTRPQQSTEFSP